MPKLVALATLLGVLSIAALRAEAAADCSPSSAAIESLESEDRCAVRALAEPCGEQERCHVTCLVERLGEEVGGGCAHICGLLDLSHPYYDCYPGSREAGAAIDTTFAIANESTESIRVVITYALSPLHDVRSEQDCLRVNLMLAPEDQIGEDSYLVDENGNLGVEAIQPTRGGTASRCIATADVPSRKVLLHETSLGYWFSEIEKVDVDAPSGDYSFSRSEIPRYDAPAESVFTWYLWRHPYHRRP